MIYRFWLTITLLLFLFTSSYSFPSFSIEGGVGKAKLDVEGHLKFKDHNINVKFTGQPHATHAYLKLKFDNPFLPSFKFETISYEFKGKGESGISSLFLLDAGTKPIFDAIPFVPSPFSFGKKYFGAAYNFFDNVYVGNAQIDVYTKVREMDYIIYYDLPFIIPRGILLIPKFGYAHKYVNLKARTVISFLLETTEKIKFQQHVPMMYYGFEAFIPVLPKKFDIEMEFEGKETGAKNKLYIDLSAVIRFRFYDTIHVGLGYRYWKLRGKNVKTEDSDVSEEVDLKYFMKGYFWETGIKF